MQGEACENSCDSADGAVGETPDQPQLAAATGAHVEGCSAAHMVATVMRKRKSKAAAAKAVGGGDGSTTADGCSTELIVLLESWSNVDNQAESGDNRRVDAAIGAESMVGRMQVVEEAIDKAADFLDSATAGVLPPDGGVQAGAGAGIC